MPRTRLSPESVRANGRAESQAGRGPRREFEARATGSDRRSPSARGRGAGAAAETLGRATSPEWNVCSPLRMTGSPELNLELVPPDAKQHPCHCSFSPKKRIFALAGPRHRQKSVKVPIPTGIFPDHVRRRDAIWKACRKIEGPCLARRRPTDEAGHPGTSGSAPLTSMGREGLAGPRFC